MVTKNFTVPSWMRCRNVWNNSVHCSKFLSQLCRQKRYVAWSTTHTEVTFKPTKVLSINVAISHFAWKTWTQCKICLENVLPLTKTTDCTDSNWKYIKFHKWHFTSKCDWTFTIFYTLNQGSSTKTAWGPVTNPPPPAEVRRIIYKNN